MKAHGHGYLPPEVPMRGTYTDLSREDAAQLDADVSLVHLMGSIRDQGPVGDCLAHAFVSAEELWARRAGLAPEPLSAVALYAATLADTGRQEDGGATMRETLAAALSGGLVTEREWEDDPARWSLPLPAELRAASSARRRVLHTMPLPPSSPDLRWALTCGHGVVAGLRLFKSSVDAASASATLALPEQGERSYTGHAVLLVGWSHARRTFLSQWAWGRDFGRGGLIEIPEAYLLDPYLAPEILALRSFRRIPGAEPAPETTHS